MPYLSRCAAVFIFFLSLHFSKVEIELIVHLYVSEVSVTGRKKLRALSVLRVIRALAMSKR